MLVGEDNQWRIRIGNYRVIYTINDAAHLVTILLIAHRREAYD
jgi:mRNA interferase RelE/StbE